jgi:phenylpropionate dioxygenase-like ring-hydroxylating dioxygenase large terminal subunit
MREIVDGQIHCAYHHWRFDDADKIAPGAGSSPIDSRSPGACLAA